MNIPILQAGGIGGVIDGLRKRLIEMLGGYTEPQIVEKIVEKITPVRDTYFYVFMGLTFGFAFLLVFLLIRFRHYVKEINEHIPKSKKEKKAVKKGNGLTAEDIVAIVERQLDFALQNHDFSQREKSATREQQKVCKEEEPEEYVSKKVKK